MLGAYQFTRAGTHFTPREAMNILMMFNNVNEKLQDLINWYTKTGKDIEPSWEFQRELMEFTKHWTFGLIQLMRETPEETKEEIINHLPDIEYVIMNSKKSANTVGAMYLYCELQNIVR